jgi:class 3 adenylate cyclase
VVMRCLRKKPEERYRSAELLVEALSRAESEATKAHPYSTPAGSSVQVEGSFTTLAVPPAPAADYDSKAERACDATANKLEIAHVLFLDIVGYSRLSLNTQPQVLQELQQIVSSSAEFVNAAKQDLIALPTGDGMALSFFSNPEAPLRCALSIAATLRQNPRIQLRMGLHSGPVYRVRDIKDNINVAGGGINFAQRVMDCGDAGHILASSTISDLLTQNDTWESCMHELGVAEVKHGVKLRIFNVYTRDAGNPAVPAKLLKKVGVSASTNSVAVLTPPPVQESRTSTIKSGPVSITPAILEQAAKALAVYIGPIAKVMAKRAAQTCTSAKEFYTTLAEEIDSAQDREKFINSRPRNWF